MTTPHNVHKLGKSSRIKKKRSTVFLVILATIVVHVFALGGLAAIKIIEVLQPEPEFEAPPVVAVKPPPPPPPPPPTSKRSQRSLPRPQPLAVQNPLDMSVPSIEINNSHLSIGGGRGFGGGLGQLGSAVADSIRITSFGYDQAMNGTLEGTLYDLKRDPTGKSLGTFEDGNAKISHASEILKDFTDKFDQSELDRKFYKSKTSLYGAYFVIPSTSASVAPEAFKAEGEIEPQLICAVYSGTFSPSDSGSFRLSGMGDDVLVVRINGKTVVDASWIKSKYSHWTQPPKGPTAQSYFGITPKCITGDWFTLRKNKETKVEIVIAEVPGGKFGAYLLIEKRGESGKKIFSTRPLGDNDKSFLRKSHPDAAQFME